MHDLFYGNRGSAWFLNLGASFYPFNTELDRFLSAFSSFRFFLWTVSELNMGGKSSALAHKIASPVTNYFYGEDGSEMDCNGEAACVAKMKASPFVFKRRR